MSWFSKSGLAQYLGSLFTTTVNNPNFQQSATEFIVGAFQKILQHKDNPQAVQAIAQGFISHPDAAVGAIVKNTEAEGLVDPEIVKKAEQAHA